MEGWNSGRAFIMNMIPLLQKAKVETSSEFSFNLYKYCLSGNTHNFCHTGNL